MDRPDCVVHIDDIPSEKRPKLTKVEGVSAFVRNLGDSVGLRSMGVHLREIEPGAAGTNRHFHNVEEEWAFVLSGSGTLRIGPHRIDVRPGSFAGFVPGPRPHHFIASGRERLVILEGGERRPAEDSGCYPDAGRIWRAGEFFDTDEAPPPEQGEATQCVHSDEIESKVFVHDVDASVSREQRSLYKPTGLVRQAVHRCRVHRGGRTTALHTHDSTEEWLLILAGRAIATSGTDKFEVGPGDFLGFPRNAPAHVLEALEDLDYLMGGQIDAADTVTYPEAGIKRVAGRLLPIAG